MECQCIHCNSTICDLIWFCALAIYSYGHNCSVWYTIKSSRFPCGIIFSSSILLLLLPRQTICSFRYYSVWFIYPSWDQIWLAQTNANCYYISLPYVCILWHLPIKNKCTSSNIAQFHRFFFFFLIISGGDSPLFGRWWQKCNFELICHFINPVNSIILSSKTGTSSLLFIQFFDFYTHSNSLLLMIRLT